MSEVFVESVLNYEASPEAVVPFVFDVAWSGTTADPRVVHIADARCRDTLPSLAREGFQLCDHPVTRIDLCDREELRVKWQPSVEALLADLTGAPEVISWSSGIRYSERATPIPGTQAPARRIHTDFGLSFDPETFVEPEFSPRLAAAKQKMGLDVVRSWCAFNVWQAFTEPPQDTPLALCDASSVVPADVVVGRGQITNKDRAFNIEVELSLLRASPRHRWLYFSAMQPSESLVFVGADSRVGGTRQTVPHSAFDDPSWPGGVAPRGSAEVRAMAIFG